MRPPIFLNRALIYLRKKRARDDNTPLLTRLLKSMWLHLDPNRPSYDTFGGHLREYVDFAARFSPNPLFFQ